MLFFIADAFSKQLFGGNPAGVVYLGDSSSFPDEIIMKKTAAELRYSETAFIKKISAKEFEIRYFTPAGEVDLCGHATIASFYCMKQKGIISEGEFVCHTLSGKINIDIINNDILMDMAKPKLIDTMTDIEKLNDLCKIMGASIDEIYLTPMTISTGLADIILPIKSKKRLDTLTPDFKALSEFSEEMDVVGVHAFSPGDDNITAYARNFAPLYEIDEEAATGTSNGSLTYYLFKQNLIKIGDECTVIQGEAMDRPSLIKTIITGSETDPVIRVGGSAVILSEGEIFL